MAYGVGKVGLVVDDGPDLHRRCQSLTTTPMSIFVSIGLFIIDDLSLTSHIGGAGTYATIGARIWSVLVSSPLPLRSLPAQAQPIRPRHDRRQGNRLSHSHPSDPPLLRPRHLALPRAHRSLDNPCPHLLPGRHQKVALLLSLVTFTPSNRVPVVSSTSHHPSSCSRGICETPLSRAPRPCISYLLPPAPSR